MNKKTKIICTMGPNSDNREIMKQLVLNGMDVARFNFSHGTHEEQKARYLQLREVADECDIPIAALLDTKGPEIRTCTLKDGKKVTLKEGQEFILTTEELVGDETMVQINYNGLNEDVAEGNRILIDDGLIELHVKYVDGPKIYCTVVNGGELGERKGVNVPGVKIKLPALTDKDKEDIRFGAQQDVDFIAASFVRNADCIREIKAILKECGAPYTPIIAKIENKEGIDNLDEILEVADGIMVARGDLGVEIPAEEVPYIQKMMINKCKECYKPVITATQMLDSMMRNPRPTRAEVTDVANAVYDGTDAVMLSGETAQGKYPLESLKMMVQICENTESHLDHDEILSKMVQHRMKDATSALGYATVSTAENLEAKCIIAPTGSGATARIISKFHPSMDVLAVSPNARALRRMQIYWGVRPYESVWQETTEAICNGATDIAKEKGFVEVGDVTVLTAGIPSPHVGGFDYGVSNMMRIVTIQ